MIQVVPLGMFVDYVNVDVVTGHLWVAGHPDVQLLLKYKAWPHTAISPSQVQRIPHNRITCTPFKFRFVLVWMCRVCVFVFVCVCVYVCLFLCLYSELPNIIYIYICMYHSRDNNNVCYNGDVS